MPIMYIEMKGNIGVNIPDTEDSSKVIIFSHEVGLVSVLKNVISQA